MHRFHLKADYLLRKNINELYIMNSIRSFAISTIMIFVPIFLLKNNYSFVEVALYVIFCYLGSIITCYFALKHASKKGVKHTIIISVPTTIVFFLLLYNINSINLILGNFWSIALIGILHAIAGAYYWMGFHVEFAKFSKLKKSAKQVSIKNVLSTVFSILGPLFGALVITNYSFNALFIIVMFLMSLSFFPLIFSEEYHEPFKFNLKKVLLKRKDHKDWPFIGEGIKDMALRIFWPILLFVWLISLNGIGGIYTISNAAIVLITLHLGKIINKKNKYKILGVGTVLHGITAILRTFFQSIAAIATIQGAGGLLGPMVHIPFNTIFYNNCKQKGIAYGVYFRELYLNIGRVIATLILLLLFLLTTPATALIISVIIGGFAGLLMKKIKDEK